MHWNPGIVRTSTNHLPGTLALLTTHLNAWVIGIMRVIVSKIVRIKRLAAMEMRFKYIPLVKRGRLAGNRGYTVVTAVYNCEPYLDHYFRSIAYQSLNFSNSIRLVLVNDGSTDDSANIIRTWQNRFPANIHLVQKERAGPGAARNTGLGLVDSEWVTFIDADDFVDVSYFHHVDEFIKNYENINGTTDTLKAISCRYIYYHENNFRFNDGHPLRMRYNNDSSFIDLADPPPFILMNSNSAFFRTRSLRDCRFRFSEEKWPCFEDGYALMKYFMKQQEGRIAFLRKPVYYYRKRSGKNSLINTAASKRSYYIDLLQDGYLDLLKLSIRERGYVPLYLQWTIIYEMTFKLRRFVETRELIPLSSNEVHDFKNLCREIFAYIDSTTIKRFPSALNGLSDAYKAMIIHQIMGKSSHVNIDLS